MVLKGLRMTWYACATLVTPKGLSIDLPAHVKAHQRGSRILLNRVAYCKNTGIMPNYTLQWDKFIRLIIIVLIDRNH